MQKRAHRLYESEESGILSNRAVKDLPVTTGVQTALWEENQKLKAEIKELQHDFAEWMLPFYKDILTWLRVQEQPTFLLDFIRWQCINGLASGAKQRHWPDILLRFFKIVRHQRSGRSVINILTGAGNFGSKTSNSNQRFNLHVPSNRTLDNYESPGYYPLPPDPQLQFLKVYTILVFFYITYILGFCCILCKWC